MPQIRNPQSAIPVRLIYQCLSPTLGMHQYTADLANRMHAAGHEVHVISAAGPPRDRYAPGVRIHTPIPNRTTGFSPEALNPSHLRRLLHTLTTLTSDPPPAPRPLPPLLHITSPHAYTPLLLPLLRRRGLPVLHTLHDLDPHHGDRFRPLIRLWNRLIVRGASHILVHGQCYRQRLLAAGCPAHRVTSVPLLHLFLSFEAEVEVEVEGRTQPQPQPQPQLAVLFFGRLLPYKGVETLLRAWQRLDGGRAGAWLVLAGPGDLEALWPRPLPPAVELRCGLAADAEALDLFRRCALVVLPYVSATQSALVAAAYYFGRPVIVSDSGALPEYVQAGVTGWVTPAGDDAALARALAEALSDPGRLARMGAAGRAWYDQQRRHEQRTLASLYHSLAASPSP